MQVDFTPPSKKQRVTSEEMETLDAKALNKFSRQNAALGADTTAKLIKMKVIIVGMRGVGIETAKNLALQGVGAITIIDPHPTEIKDLGLNFFLTEDDVNHQRSRGEASASKLCELNTMCKITVEKTVTSELLSSHTALIITEPRTLSDIIYHNTLCRQHHISFFYALSCGISTTIFVDHGVNHVITDPTGEKPVQKLITDFTKLSETEILVRYDHPAGQLPEAINNGTYEITEVVGLSTLNNQVFEVKRDFSDPVKTVRITIPSTSILDSTPYISGGLLTEKKVPTKNPMFSFPEKIKNPGSTWDSPPSLVLTDLLNIGSELQQHVAFCSLLQYIEDKSNELMAADITVRPSRLLPQVYNIEDAKNVIECAKKLLCDKVIDINDFELDESFVERYALYAGVELQPISAFTGGVLAQEVVKCTGKFTPIPGFLHFSAPETLPAEKPDFNTTLPKNNRYDELASLFGWDFIETLGNLKYFMVGCGALGCEFVKNFALNGICCGPAGKLIITDGDRIELSNLTRQFLFREHNVGHLKSAAAGIMAKQMNSNLHTEALELYVGPNTEDIFNDIFWYALHGICNALDNMEARKYVDKMCIKYEKSLLESGTMGTSGNIDTICPYKTQTYSDGGNAVEGGQIPMCTLRNFPQITDHCIEWARDQFALLFTRLIKYVESYTSDSMKFEEEILSLTDTAQAIFIIRSVTSIFKAISAPSMTSLAQIAYDIFHFLFRDKILDLQTIFPKDKRIIDGHGHDKGPFWGEKRRYPTVAEFNLLDETHSNFISSTMCLFGASLSQIPPKQEDDDHWCDTYRSTEYLSSVIPQLTVPEYIFSPVNTSDGDDDMNESTTNSTTTATKKEEILANLLNQLKSVSQTIPAMPSLTYAEFEKDDDYNFHIAFVTATANLRCDNYSIKRTNFHSCKVIAGKIIAAIATTTAAVCGLVMLELFKLVQLKPTESYMNRQIGLATNTYTSFTAEHPVKQTTKTETVPPPSDETTPEMYDEHGNIKKEYYISTVKRVYPENHTVWDKIVCPGNQTLFEFSTWLEKTHNLKLLSWDFIIGYKQGVDEEGKKTGSLIGNSTPIFPPKPILDPILLPSLDLSLPQATQQIMKNTLAKPTQEYIKLWKECKSKGIIDTDSLLLQQKDAITKDTTIKDILLKMESLGQLALDDKKIETKTVTGISSRSFFIVPSNEAPRCMDITSGDEIDTLASLKFDFTL